jgi:hypothetical protein
MGKVNDVILKIRMPRKMREKYSKFCDEYNISMAQRIRMYIIKDLEIWERNKRNARRRHRRNVKKIQEQQNRNNNKDQDNNQD